MIDINELRRLAQAVSGWSNCNQAWLDQSEDVQAAVVGHIDEDGNTYPVATIDCDRYYAAHQSLPLAKFYAAANPAAITELLDRLEAAEKDIAIKEEVIDSLAAVVKRLDAQCDAAEAEAIEQARLNGMGSEREAALLAKLEAAEKERDALRAELDALRAWKEEIEKQEPVGYWDPQDDMYFLPGFLLAESQAKMEPRYARPLPPAPSVPDGFSREDLEAVADGLDGYEKTVNVGNVTGGGDDHLESTTAYAARFIRAMLAAPETNP